MIRRNFKPIVAFGAALVATLVLSAPAAATWSVVATDQQTGEVGVAIASCVPMSALGDLQQPLPPVVLVPNKGAAASQGFLNSDSVRRIRELLEVDRTPEEILGDITTPDFDEEVERRQHAIVSFSGLPANFTGSDLEAIAFGLTQPSVSVQGNIMASDAVMADALAAFESTIGLPLGERLVEALMAGSAAGGDSRCGEQTALFAHVSVAEPGDDPFSPSTMLTIARAEGGDNPVAELVAIYASGERRAIDVPSQQGNGGIVAMLILAIAVLMVPTAVWYWRWAYRKPRY